jgi:endonuclease V
MMSTMFFPSSHSANTKLFTPEQRAILKTWIAEQNNLKSQLILSDDTLKRKPHLIAGVDISFFHGNTSRAVASLIIIKVISSGQYITIYEGYDTHVNITEPYIAGFLAFRELKPLLGLFEKLKCTYPEYWPDAVVVDGNGILHQRGFGLASHLGVMLDLPTVGVGKNLLVVPRIGVLDSDKERVRDWAKTAEPLSAMPLGRMYGKPVAAAMKVGNTSQVVYISQGHRVTLETAVRVVRLVGCHKDTCEVVRLADRKSRDLIRRIEREKQ